MNYPKSRNDPMDAHHDEVGEPTKYPVYRCAFAEQAFTREQREWIGIGVASMSALGPTCVWITDGSPVDVLFAHWPDFDPSTGNAGRTTIFADRDRAKGPGWIVELDPNGLHGELQWIEAAAHETGHVFGMQHTDGHAPAIMKPTLDEVTFDPSDWTDIHGSAPPRGPTQADFDEFDRVHGVKA